MPSLPDTILAYSDLSDDHVHDVTHYYTIKGLPVPTTHNVLHYLNAFHIKFQGSRTLPDPPVAEDPAPTEEVHVYVNHGRWLWQCPRCFSGIYAERPDDHPNPHLVTACVYCPFDGWKRTVFPTNWEEIEEELMRQPGYRKSAPIRTWMLGWTLEYLQERTALAEASSDPNPRKLSIGLSHIWSIGERLTAAGMNLWISDLIDDLAGRNGIIEFEDNLRTGGVGQLQLEPRSGVVPQFEGGVSYDGASKSLRLDAGISGVNREMTVPAAVAADLVDGDVIVRDSTAEGGWLRLPPGGVGTTLTSRGPGLTPHWT